MIESCDAGGGVGVLEDSPSLLARSCPAESSASPLPAGVLSHELGYARGLGYTRGYAPEAALAALRDRFAAYRNAELRTLARVCIAAAYASALRVPYWMAHSQRDYARAILGVKHPTLSRWVMIGRLLSAHPELRAAMRAGKLTMTALEGMARGKLAVASNGQAGLAAGSEDGAAPPSLADSIEYVCLSISAPAPAVLYVTDSLQLARGFVGVTDGDEDALSALLAEAASDCTDRGDPAVVRARFKVKGKGRREEGANAAATPPELPSQRVSPPPHPPLAQLGETAQRSAALRVHAVLARLVSRRDQLRVRQEDQLYQWRLEGVHERNGFRNFERFAEEVLNLPYVTCRERLRNALLRRQDNAIAIARRDGKITAVQAQLLDQLYRECSVPSSDLAHWCDYAAAHTVRRIRAALRWAKREISLDYRRWSLSHCTPPDEDQLRTTDHSLEALVRDPGTDVLSDALLDWSIAPLGTVRLRITRETRDELLVQMASMQDEIRGAAPQRVPAWLALCRVLHRAREAWRLHYQAPPAALRRILDRDGYQCMAPECTQRRNLQVHHVKYRSRGGDDRDSNRVTLCAFHHHHGEHGGLMKVRGELDALGRGLTWEMGLDKHGRAQQVYRDERVLPL